MPHTRQPPPKSGDPSSWQKQFLTERNYPWYLNGLNTTTGGCLVRSPLCDGEYRPRSPLSGCSFGLRFPPPLSLHLPLPTCCPLSPGASPRRLLRSLLIGTAS